MIEPVALQDFFITFFSAAMVVLSGATYAALYAWSRLSRKASLIAWAYVSYAVLVAAVIALADSANLNGFWRIVVGLMLVGYLLAPRGIWRLCEASHAVERESDSKRAMEATVPPAPEPTPTGDPSITTKRRNP